MSILFVLKNQVSQITGFYFRSILNNDNARHFYLKNRSGLSPNYPRHVPANLADYQPIGHDRRYDKLGIKGMSGLSGNTIAIGADWKFVMEERSIAANSKLYLNDRTTAARLGIGLGLFVLPKTVYAINQPSGVDQIISRYEFSNQAVNNAPTIHKH